MVTQEQLKELNKKDLMLLINKMSKEADAYKASEGETGYPLLGTWTSPKSGLKFLTINFSAYGKGIMLSVDQWNTLIDVSDSVADFIDENEID